MYNPTKYKCPNCGWIGTSSQMVEGTKLTEGGKVWSDMVCPECQTFYWQLDEYIRLDDIREVKNV